MNRCVAGFLLALFLGVLHAPLFILVEFHLHRASIERELCVQRDVVAEMRTCHGECQLSKRFRALEQEAQAGFPVERIQVRYEPQVVMDVKVGIASPRSFDRRFPELVQTPIQLVLSNDDPVPRG